ncbi:unnamed protein product [Bursaphelenchus xylophilus]|nr:unnamed protein product [Bursaphelenchus xylophilus]CAG9125394.1 unnamed protein product [Bursaphelenchus xylophilus]
MSDQELTENLSFLLNNLTDENVEQTGQYLKELSVNFTEDVEKHLALILIRRRVAVEQNHVGLYVKLALSLESETFQANLLLVTINYATQLMDGARTAANQNPRDLLRNLGTFLGLITWGRDLELPTHLLDPLELLKEAEREGQEKMEKILPFVANMLRACKTSKVFKPNHPRIQPIFEVLKRIHSMENMKMTLCFEVEALFDDLRAPTPPPEEHSFAYSDPHTSGHLSDQSMEQSFFSQSSYQAPPLFAQFQQQGLMDNPMALQALMNPAYLQQIQYQQHVQPDFINSLQAPPFHPRPPVPPGMTFPIQEQAIEPPAPRYQPPHVRFQEAQHQAQHHQQPPQMSLESHDMTKVFEERRIWDPNPAAKKETNAFVAKDKELVWSLIDAIDFTCSPVFQLHNTAKGRVTESIFGYLTDVEKMLAPILKRLCEPLGFSAASLLYRDFAFVDIQSFEGMKKINRSVYKALLFALYYRQNANEAAYKHMKRTIEAAVARAMEYERAHQRGVAPAELEWTKQMSARQFAHANAHIIGTFICEVLERFSHELADLHLFQFIEERKVHPDWIGLRRFAYNPTSREELEDMLPEPLRHKNVPEDHVLVYGEFEKLTAQLKEDVMNSLKNFDTKVFTDVAREDVEAARNPVQRGPIFQRSGFAPQPTSQEVKFDKKPIDEFTRKVLLVFREWCVSSRAPDPARRESFKKIVEFVYANELLTDMSEVGRFFEICLQVCIDLSEHLESFQEKATTEMELLKIDRQLFNHVKALALLVDRLADEQDRREHTRTRFIAHFIRVVIQTHVKKFEEWNEPTTLQIAIFYHTYYWIVTTQTRFDNQKNVKEFIDIFATAIQTVSPLNMPYFIFSYTSIIAHPQLMRSILASPEMDPAKSANFYMMLIKPLLECHRKLCESEEDIHKEAVHHLNKGLSRVFSYLQHDFPGFFVRKYSVVLKMVPLICIHLRNLVVGAVPEETEMIEANLGFDRCCMSDQMNLNPEVHNEFLMMASEDSKNLTSRATVETANPDFIPEFIESFKSVKNDVNQFDLAKITDFLTYFGALSVSEIRAAKASVSMVVVANNRVVKVLENALRVMDSEGTYMFLNALMDQLRYPNSHTAFFCGVLLVLFKSGHEHFKEVMSRIMFERILTFPPCPFGLKLLLCELFTNSSYDFFANDFLHATPVIERLCVESAKNILNVTIPITSILAHFRFESLNESFANMEVASPTCPSMMFQMPMSPIG